MFFPIFFFSLLLDVHLDSAFFFIWHFFSNSCCGVRLLPFFSLSFVPFHHCIPICRNIQRFFVAFFPCPLLSQDIRILLYIYLVQYVRRSGQANCETPQTCQKEKRFSACWCFFFEDNRAFLLPEDRSD